VILFLDIDGVLCTHRTSIALGEQGRILFYLDPVALSFFDRLCRVYDVSVVVSSTWRKTRTRGNLYDIFATGGYTYFAGSLHKDWATPVIRPESVHLYGDNSGNCLRGCEIQEWLNKHPGHRFIIVDDSSDFLDYQKTFHIKTDTHNGILMEHYIRIEEIVSKSAKLIR